MYIKVFWLFKLSKPKFKLTGACDQTPANLKRTSVTLRTPQSYILLALLSSSQLHPCFTSSSILELGRSSKVERWNQALTAMATSETNGWHHSGSVRYLKQEKVGFLSVWRKLAEDITDTKWFTSESSAPKKIRKNNLKRFSTQSAITTHILYREETCRGLIMNTSWISVAAFLTQISAFDIDFPCRMNPKDFFLQY